MRPVRDAVRCCLLVDQIVTEASLEDHWVTYLPEAVRLHVLTCSVVAGRLHPRAHQNVRNMRWCYVHSRTGPLATLTITVGARTSLRAVLREPWRPRFARRSWR